MHFSPHINARVSHKEAGNAVKSTVDHSFPTACVQLNLQMQKTLLVRAAINIHKICTTQQNDCLFVGRLWAKEASDVSLPLLVARGDHRRCRTA